MTRPELTIHPTCPVCGHRMSDHGDRALGGNCSVGTYPNVCKCDGRTPHDH